MSSTEINCKSLIDNGWTPDKIVAALKQRAVTDSMFRLKSPEDEKYTVVEMFALGSPLLVDDLSKLDLQGMAVMAVSVMEKHKKANAVLPRTMELLESSIENIRGYIQVNRPRTERDNFADNMDNLVSESAEKRVAGELALVAPEVLYEWKKDEKTKSSITPGEIADLDRKTGIPTGRLKSIKQLFIDIGKKLGKKETKDKDDI